MIDYDKYRAFVRKNCTSSDIIRKRARVGAIIEQFVPKLVEKTAEFYKATDVYMEEDWSDPACLMFTIVAVDHFEQNGYSIDVQSVDGVLYDENETDQLIKLSFIEIEDAGPRDNWHDHDICECEDIYIEIMIEEDRIFVKSSKLGDVDPEKYPAITKDRERIAQYFQMIENLVNSIIFIRRRN